MLNVFLFTIILNGSQVERVLYFDNDNLVIVENYIINDKIIREHEKIIHYTLNDSIVNEKVGNDITNISLDEYPAGGWSMSNRYGEKVIKEISRKEIENGVTLVLDYSLTKELYILQDIPASADFPDFLKLNLVENGKKYLITQSTVQFKDRNIFHSELVETREGTDEDKVFFEETVRTFKTERIKKM